MIERARCEAAVSALASRTSEDRRDLVLGLGTLSETFFEVLLREIREGGRQDRGLGLELAELGRELVDWRLSPDIASKAACRLRIGVRLALANARRLALDFDGAEVAIGHAAHIADLGGLGREASGKVALYRAGLRWYERRLDEATSFVEEALAKLVQPTRERLEALSLRSVVQIWTGDPEAALAGLEASMPLAREVDDCFLTYGLLFNQARCLVDLGRGAEALALVPDVRAGANALCAPLQSVLVEALGGYAAASIGELDAAAESLELAVTGLRDLDTFEYAATVGVDLALVYHQAGRVDDVLRACAVVLPALDALSFHGEALGAYRLLREAIRSRAVTFDSLARVRNGLADRTRAMLPQPGLLLQSPG